MNLCNEAFKGSCGADLTFVTFLGAGQGSAGDCCLDESLKNVLGGEYSSKDFKDVMFFCEDFIKNLSDSSSIKGFRECGSLL